MSGVRIEFTPSGKPMKHGGSGMGYSHYGCRCEECTAANTWRYRRRTNARRPEDAPAGSHGSPSTYVNWHCRCVECRAAMSAKNRAYREAHKRPSH